MSSEGIVTYNFGLSCVPRMFVMLATLRTHYSGPLVLMVPNYDDAVEQYRSSLRRFDVDLATFNVPTEFQNDLKVTAKLWIAQQSPFDRTLIYENDFLFQGSPEPLFQLCERAQFGIASFHGLSGTTKGTAKMLQGRWKDFPLREYMEGPETRSYNHGVIYIEKNSEFLKHWASHTTTWRQWTCAEEHVCNILVNRYRSTHGAFWTEIPEKYNTCVRFAPQAQVDDAVALHFLGARHTGGVRKNDSPARWLDAFRRVAGRSLPCFDGLMRWDPAVFDKIESKEWLS